jgi:hypothetical protein
MVTSDTASKQRDWMVEGFRATIFHNDFHVNAQDVAEIWERVARGQPEQVSSRPREGLILAEGPYDDYNLICRFRLDRVDWNLEPVPPLPNVPVEGFPTIGPLLDRLPSLLAVATNLLRECPDVARLAFGSVLALNVADLADGYSALNTLLPRVELDPTGSSDFFYQINRRRISTSMAAIAINRLSKWSVMQGSSVGISLTPNTGPQFLPGRDQFACRLELDINTAGPLPNTFDGEQAVELFQELMNLGKEIAERGDIA